MQLPYWRLSAFYFAYFAFVGSFTPYWSLYLKSLGFAAFQIAVLMSLFQVARIFAPSLWGWLADHLGRRVPIIQWLAGLSLVSYIGVFVGVSYAWLFAVMLLLSFFWGASLPLIEAVTLGLLGDRFDCYGHIRMWGSIGFILAWFLCHAYTHYYIANECDRLGGFFVGDKTYKCVAVEDRKNIKDDEP